METSCILCDEVGHALIKLTAKGLKTLHQYAEKREDLHVKEKIDSHNNNSQDVYVHADCRKSFTDKRKIKVKVKERETRKSSKEFDLKVSCIFCSEPCVNDGKNPSRKSWVPARTLKFKETIISMCKSRLDINPDDDWAIRVESGKDRIVLGGFVARTCH